MSWTKEQCRAYMKDWYATHKESEKAAKKEYNKAHKKERQEYYKAHKEECRAYRQAHKEKAKAQVRAWQAANKERYNAYRNSYYKSDLNSLGQTKNSIRLKSWRYLNKYGTKIPGYEIHHCCTYTEPYKFIYCSKEKHLKIHQFLRDNNIDADTDHYDKIKHLLDENVVVFGI